MASALTTIAIVGGGMAGWFVAAGLARFTQGSGIRLLLIEPPDKPKAQAESAGPLLRAFHDFLGIREDAFVSRTQATFRLGDEMADWGPGGKSFFKPYGFYGAPIEQADFFSCWLRLRDRPSVGALEQYSLPRMLAKYKKFARPGPDEAGRPPFARFDYGYHFDAVRYTGLLRQLATGLGVNPIPGKVVGVQQSEAGFINALVMEDAADLEADLYIDCLGQPTRLFGVEPLRAVETLSTILPSMQMGGLRYLDAGPEPFSRFAPLPAGFTRAQPLQHECDVQVWLDPEADMEATLDSLAENREGVQRRSPERLTFAYRRQAWRGNCLALGSSAGRVPDLGGTQTQLLLSSVSRLFNFFPHQGVNRAEVSEYNREVYQEWGRAADFALLHLWGRRHLDDGFWGCAASVELPKMLAHKLSVFEERGALVRYGFDAASDISWQSLLEGLQLLPHSYDFRAKLLDEERLLNIFSQMRTAIQTVVQDTPLHSKYMQAAALASAKPQPVPTAAAPPSTG